MRRVVVFFRNLGRFFYEDTYITLKLTLGGTSKSLYVSKALGVAIAAPVLSFIIFSSAEAMATIAKAGTSTLSTHL